MFALIQKIIVPTAAMIWASLYFFEVLQLSERNQYLIRPVFYIMLGLYIVNTVTDYFDWKKLKTIEEKGEKKPIGLFKDVNYLKTLGLVVLTSAGYIALMKPLGFVLSTVVYLFLQLIILKSTNKIMIIGLPIILTVVVFLIFRQVLGVPLPRGILGI
jgi:hypothetical protein